MGQSNKSWFVSGFSTAAGVIVEWNPNDGYNSSVESYSGKLPEYRLRGFAVSGSTVLAISSTPMKLRYGKSSDATLTSVVLTAEPGVGMLGAANLMGLEAGYFAIQSTVAHADGGLTVLMWGN